jgi:hypothetical protein
MACVKLATTRPRLRPAGSAATMFHVKPKTVSVAGDGVQARRPPPQAAAGGEPPGRLRP